VHSFTGREEPLPLEVDLYDTVLSVKRKIQAKEGIPPDQQRLFIAGEQLVDTFTLDAHFIKRFYVLRLHEAKRITIECAAPPMQLKHTHAHHAR
jgi:ubiquitin